MSGGHFQYLYAKDVARLLEEGDHRSETRRLLDEMRDELVKRELSDVVSEFDAFVELLDHVQSAIDSADVVRLRLAPVLKAIEWRRSGDWGEHHIADAVETYRRGGVEGGASSPKGETP